MIYLDNAATTKPSALALKRAEIYNSENYFNPSALYHVGLSVAKEIKVAKENVLRYLGCPNYEVIFTSCGSESDNLAVFGAVKRGVFITSAGEHSAIYKSFLELKNRGKEIYFAPLNHDGAVNVNSLCELVRTHKADFVSVMHVNNETGAINDVNAIGKKLKEINKNIIFHVDGVQAYGKLPFRLSSAIDMYSISAHKINALKGTGALIKRKNLNVSPIIFGGGQENGVRSGTENVFGIKVFDFASEEHFSSLKDNFDKVSTFNKIFREKLNSDIFTIISSETASPYILCVSANGIRGEVLMHSIEEQGIIVGNGSACSSKNRYSRVIEACGYDAQILDGVIRISFSQENTIEEIEKAVEIVNQTAEKLKRIMK